MRIGLMAAAIDRLVGALVLAVAFSASSPSSAAPLSEQSELLCSPEGLMRLIPQFNANGQFTIQIGRAHV